MDSEISMSSMKCLKKPGPKTHFLASIFKKLFMGLRKNESADENGCSIDALTAWSLIHGFTTMLINNTIAYEGNYLDAVSVMLEKKLKL